MKKIIWLLLYMIDDNHGYSTPLQKRFNIGDVCKISNFKIESTMYNIGEKVTIIEKGRHDYLVMNNNGDKRCVYQFELC